MFLVIIVIFVVVINLFLRIVLWGNLRWVICLIVVVVMLLLFIFLRVMLESKMSVGGRSLLNLVMK